MVADGTHAGLLAQSPRYRELVTGQEAERPADDAAAPAAAREPAPVPVPSVPFRGGRGGGTGLVRDHHWFTEAVVADDTLAAQVAALPPATDEPGIDPAAAARPDPGFRLSRFVRPWRGPWPWAWRWSPSTRWPAWPGRPWCEPAWPGASRTAGERCWWRSAPASDTAYARVRDKVAGVMASLQEGLSGARVTQAFARQERNISELRQLAGEHLDARLEGNRLSAAYLPAVELLGQVATVVVVAYGAGRVGAGSITPADLIAFVLYLNLFFAPLTQLSQAFDLAQQAKAAAKLSELLATPVSVADRPGAPSPPSLTGALRLAGVR